MRDATSPALLFAITAFLLCPAATVTGQSNTQNTSQRSSNPKPVLRIAKGLNNDGSLAKYYQRGLDYAIKYFGNHGPYFVYLLGPDSEQSVRDIYSQRARSRVDPNSKQSAMEQMEAFLEQPNIRAEIQAVLSGKAE